MECSTVAPRSAKQARPQANPVKLQCVLGIHLCCLLSLISYLIVYIHADEVRKAFPGGFDITVMKQRMNQCFIDFRNKHKN